MKPTKKRYKAILAVIMILLLLTFSGCTHKGDYELYYKGEFHGIFKEWKRVDGEICILGTHNDRDVKVWYCFNKKHIEIKG